MLFVIQRMDSLINFSFLHAICFYFLPFLLDFTFSSLKRLLFQLLLPYLWFLMSDRLTGRGQQMTTISLDSFSQNRDPQDNQHQSVLGGPMSAIEKTYAWPSQICHPVGDLLRSRDSRPPRPYLSHRAVSWRNPLCSAMPLVCSNDQRWKYLLHVQPFSINTFLIPMTIPDSSIQNLAVV